MGSRIESYGGGFHYDGDESDDLDVVETTSDGLITANFDVTLSHVELLEDTYREIIARVKWYNGNDEVVHEHEASDSIDSGTQALITVDYNDGLYMRPSSALPEFMGRGYVTVDIVEKNSDGNTVSTKEMTFDGDRKRPVYYSLNGEIPLEDTSRLDLDRTDGGLSRSFKGEEISTIDVNSDDPVYPWAVLGIKDAGIIPTEEFRRFTVTVEVFDVSSADDIVEGDGFYTTSFNKSVSQNPETTLEFGEEGLPFVPSDILQGHSGTGFITIKVEEKDGDGTLVGERYLSWGGANGRAKEVKFTGEDSGGDDEGTPDFRVNVTATSPAPNEVYLGIDVTNEGGGGSSDITIGVGSETGMVSADLDSGESTTIYTRESGVKSGQRDVVVDAFAGGSDSTTVDVKDEEESDSTISLSGSLRPNPSLPEYVVSDTIDATVRVTNTGDSKYDGNVEFKVKGGGTIQSWSVSIPSGEEFQDTVTFDISGYFNVGDSLSLEVIANSSTQGAFSASVVEEGSPPDDGGSTPSDEGLLTMRDMRVESADGVVNTKLIAENVGGSPISGEVSFTPNRESLTEKTAQVDNLGAGETQQVVSQWDGVSDGTVDVTATLANQDMSLEGSTVVGMLVDDGSGSGGTLLYAISAGVIGLGALGIMSGEDET